MSRPESKNVFYFPHFTKPNGELELIEYRYGSDGYMAYYKILELVADADYHKLSLKHQDDRDIFNLKIKLGEQITSGVIEILINKGKVDKELYDNDNVIWMEDFVQTLKPVYVNRKKPLPTKSEVSTCRNMQKRKENKRKQKKREKKDDSLRPLEFYEKEFPTKDIANSLRKYKEWDDNCSHDGAMKWFKREKNLKKDVLQKTNSGMYKVWCSKCGKKDCSESKWIIKELSNCCKADYSTNEVERKNTV